MSWGQGVHPEWLTSTSPRDIPYYGMPFPLYKLGQVGQELPMAAHGLAGHLSAGDKQLQ